MDSYQHVNNVMYFRWFESARIAYLEQIELKALYHTAGIGPILAAIGCNFRRQLTYPDTIAVGARISHIGRTSFVMDHVLFSTARQEIIADGTSTIVTFDYRQQKPIPVPAEIREKIARLEGRDFPPPS
jgi:acyl-CoA thioester hydrolase